VQCSVSASTGKRREPNRRHHCLNDETGWQFLINLCDLREFEGNLCETVLGSGIKD